jgi:phosphoribosylformimino-5-aminoimidazole carboxamide ribonucleotide (ProFAR) isomerase
VLAACLSSASVGILASYANFFGSLRVTIIAGGDVRTTSNLKLIEELTGLNPRIFGSARINEDLTKEEIARIIAAITFQYSRHNMSV